MGFHRLDEDTIVRYEPSLSTYLVLYQNNLLFLDDQETIKELHAELNYISDDHLKKQQNYSIPMNVQIQVTRGCNFACSFCYASAVNANNPDVYMEYGKLRDIVDLLYDWGVPNIQYVGGETFMHPNFKQLVEYGKQKGLSQTLITNGIIPGLKISEYRDTISAFSKIQISINAIGENFDEIVGRNIFTKFKSCLGTIAGICDNTWASFVVTEQSVNDIEELFVLVKEAGLRGIRFGILAPQGRGKTNVDIKQYFSTVALANTKIERLREKFQEVDIECHFNPTLNTEKYPLQGGAGVSVLFINKDGNIYPFPLLEDKKFLLGNVFKDDIVSIWNTHPILEELRSPSAFPEPCLSCDISCPISSPVMFYLWNGKIGESLPCIKTNFTVPESRFIQPAEI